MTNKNETSTAAGGPYTPLFKEMAENIGMSLDAAMNKVLLPGHQGPHPEYNAEVFSRLNAKTAGRSGGAYTTAFMDEFEAIKAETVTPGTRLNQLATGHKE